MQQDYYDIFEIIDLIKKNNIIMNTCEISPLLTEVVSHTTNSSVVVFADLLKKGVNLGKDMPLAIKMYLTVPPLKTDDEEYFYYYATYAGLEYEVKMYKLVNILLEEGCSTFFIPFVGYGKCNICKSQNYIYTWDIRDFFDRFASYEPIIENNPTLVPSQLELNTLIIGRPYENTVSLERFLLDMTHKDPLLPVLVQCLYNIWLMEILKIKHGDLHLGNILVTTTDKPKRMLLKFGENKKDWYEFETRYYVLFFDWDFGYYELFGKNLLYDTGNSDIKNKFQKNWDLTIFLCYQILLINYTSFDKEYIDALNLLIGNKDHKKIFESGDYGKNSKIKGFTCRLLDEELENNRMQYKDIDVFMSQLGKYKYTGSGKYDVNVSVPSKDKIKRIVEKIKMIK